MSQPSKLKRIVIKEEFVALTGDYVDAVILNQFLYWSERVRDFDVFIEEEMSVAAILGGQVPELQKRNGWIYKSCEELSEEIMIRLSPSNMRKHIKALVEKGWLDERNNPSRKWDKKKQYRVNLLKINKDLQELGYFLQDYKIDMTEIENRTSETENAFSKTENGASKTENASSEIENGISKTENRTAQNRKAIPEITIETTTENIPETTKTDTVSPSIGDKDNNSTEGRTYSISFHKSEEWGKSRDAPTVEDDLPGLERVKERCELHVFTDPDTHNMLSHVLELMWFSEKLKVGEAVIPRAVVRSRMQLLTGAILAYALHKAHSPEIRNTTSYLISCIYNGISEYHSDVALTFSG
ncbi:hypothetical protein DFR58_14710 [Anaerobacterium chartisolvens]|uniref:Uncharacterized protein n=1 Tax=Anaerobacterium chartisolvens TaxID=1297424 RepID=A0A369AEX9_9FIRM|nr:hypothetical protein [Anaerobacterium chartisolvens]RCX07890.1 hypothetical protein DFR58_14710 [Anaerobacterium chartisolvens]